MVSIPGAMALRYHDKISEKAMWKKYAIRHSSSDISNPGKR